MPGTRCALVLRPRRLLDHLRRRLRRRPDNLHLALLELEIHRGCGDVFDAVELHRTIDGIEGIGRKFPAVAYPCRDQLS